MSTTLYEQYHCYGSLSRVAGLDLAFDVRFGGENSRAHPMWLRLGPVEHDDTVAGHLLVEIGTRVDVVRDAVVCDHAVRAFVLGDTREINRLPFRTWRPQCFVRIQHYLALNSVGGFAPLTKVSRKLGLGS
jgi:hypothetical protein